MARLPSISGLEAVNAFNKDGWSMVRQTGSHMIMTKPNTEATLSIPRHKELDRGTLRKLIKHAGLNVDEFVSLLRG